MNNTLEQIKQEIIDKLPNENENNVFKSIINYDSNINWTWEDVIDIFEMYIYKQKNLHQQYAKNNSNKYSTFEFHQNQFSVARFSIYSQLGLDINYRDGNHKHFLNFLLTTTISNPHLKEYLFNEHSDILKNIIDNTQNIYEVIPEVELPNTLFLIFQNITYDDKNTQLFSIFDYILKKHPPTEQQFNQLNNNNNNIFNIYLKKFQTNNWPEEHHHIFNFLVKNVSFTHKNHRSENVLFDINQSSNNVKKIEFFMSHGVDIFENNNSGVCFLQIILENKIKFRIFKPYIEKWINEDNWEKYGIDPIKLESKIHEMLPLIQRNSPHSTFLFDIIKKSLLNDNNEISHKKSKLKL